MNIEINWYKNLHHLRLELDDHKINMIFGISGSGKSSISNALQELEFEKNSTLGSGQRASVRINDSEQLPEVRVFSKDAIDDFILVRDMCKIQSVLVEDAGKYHKAEKQLKSQLQNVEKVLEDNSQLADFYRQIKNELGSDLTKEGKLRANSRIVGLKKTFDKVQSKKIWDHIMDMPSGKLGWMKQGSKYVTEDICPYCERRLPKKQKIVIEKTNSFEQKTIDSIINIQNNEKDNLIQPDVFTMNGIIQLENNVIEIVKALKDYDKIVKFVKSLNELEDLDEIKCVEPTEQLKAYFHGVYDSLIILNEHKERLDRISHAVKNNTKQILSRRLNKINGYLQELSMPFKLKAEYANGHIKSYSIVYNDDPLQEDRPYALSEGEKCVLAQLLFIFMCKKENNELIIIDDPASAFDDFRRGQILKIVKQELDGRTILMLSHDNVYAKYAIAEKTKIGRVLFIENFSDNINLRSVDRNDFGEFNDFVISRIRESNDYYQKIINLRLLFEGSHNSPVYGYLSAIIHKTTRLKLTELLEEKNIEETHLIELIKKKFPELKDVDIPVFSDDYNIDVSSYSLLEMAFYIRDDESNKSLKSELNDFAHVNRYMKICLNPYKYNYCTSKLYGYIKGRQNEKETN